MRELQLATSQTDFRVSNPQETDTYSFSGVTKDSIEWKNQHTTPEPAVLFTNYSVINNVSSTFWTNENVPNFIKQSLKGRNPKENEYVASEIHETNKIPDPYVFVISGDGKLRLPTGEIVEEYIDTSTRLGKLEMMPFQNLQGWAYTKEDIAHQVAVWFSPPTKDGFYPKSKFIASTVEISDGVPVLFNRAVALSISQEELSDLATLLSNHNHSYSEDELRSKLFFTSRSNFQNWLKHLPDSDQVELINQNLDVKVKTETVQRVTKLETAIQQPHGGGLVVFETLSNAAQEKGLYGNFDRTCPTAIGVVQKTAFETTLSQSKIVGGEDEHGPLKFPCHECGKENTRPHGQLLEKCQHCPAIFDKCGPKK